MLFLYNPLGLIIQPAQQAPKVFADAVTEVMKAA
jgi:hypothetical protein